MKHLAVSLQALVLDNKVGDLERERLVVLEQSLLLVLFGAYLLNKVECGGPFVLVDLGLGESSACLDELALVGDDHALQLLSLAKHLLPASLDLFLEMQVLLQEGVPFALAEPLPPFVLLQHLFKTTDLLRLVLE